MCGSLALFEIELREEAAEEEEERGTCRRRRRRRRRRCEASGEQVIYAPADSSAGGLVK